MKKPHRTNGVRCGFFFYGLYQFQLLNTDFYDYRIP